MSELQVILINSSFYLLLFFYCIYRYKVRNLSTLLSLLYFVNSFCAILLFINPLYPILHPAAQGICTIEASAFLFVVNALLILAFDKCDISGIRVLKDYDANVILSIEKFLIICYIIYLIFQLPQSIEFYLSSENLDELRARTYEGHMYSNNILVTNIHKLFSNSLLILLIIVTINYSFFKKLSGWDYLAVVVFVIMKVCSALGWISRVAVVFPIIEIGMIVLLFFDFISKRVVKKMLRWSFLVLIPVLSFMLSISFARFGNREIGKETYSLLLYSGESQLNFMALPWNYLKEPFHGYQTFPLFRKYMGLDYPQGVTREETSGYDVDIQKKYHYYQPTYIFHGLAGRFYFDWGIYGAFVIALLLYLALHRTFKSRTRISFMTIVTVVFLASLVGKGIFYCDHANKAGNFMILFMVLLFLFLKSNGKDYIVKLSK